MRILYVSNANVMAGASLALLNIIKEMKKRGHETLVVTTKDKGPLLEKLDENDCPYIQLNMRGTIYPTNPNPFLYLPRLCWMLICNFLASRTLKKIIAAYGPDLVHTNVGPMAIAVDVCNELRVPHVWHHREYIDIGLNYKYFPNYKRFLFQNHRKGNYNICITRGIFRHSDFRQGIDRVIYDGVFSSSAGFPQMVKEKKKYVLYVGRVTPSKGTLDVIRVFSDFIKKYPDYRLLIAGYYDKSPYAMECFKMAKIHNIEERVVFLGECNDVYSLMANASMLIVPSYFEGFGFITAEAMLNYCPVIGRNTGGTKEQFDRGLEHFNEEIGLRFTTDEEMLSCMSYIVDNDVTEMCNRAREMVTRFYTSEQCADQIEKYYNFVLADSKSSD